MANSPEYMGVILAAGKSTRMHPFSSRYPKPILPVMGKPLLAHQIEMLADLDVRDLVIVIGHLGHEVVRELGDGSRFGVHINYVEQDHTLGIAHAVSRLEQHVDRPFFLFLGDIFFEVRTGAGLDNMIEQLRSDSGTSGVIAVTRESDPEAIKRNFIVISQGGRVTRVIEKPRHPQVDVKGCGIYLFDNAFFDAVRRTPRTAMRDEYEITDSIQIFIDDGYRVEAADIIQRDVNLSYPQDLLDLNLDLLERSGEQNFLGDGVEVHQDADIRGSVLMNGARVVSPVTMRACLVMPGVEVDTRQSQRQSLSRTILTGDAEIHCEG